MIAELGSKYRCIASDTYGAARSTSQGERLTLEGLAEDVNGAMDALKLEKAVIAGHSMGGTMACTLAGAFQDRRAGIVCVGPVNPASVKAEMFQQRIEAVKRSIVSSLSDTARDRVPASSDRMERSDRVKFGILTEPFVDGMESLADTIPKAATNMKR